MLCYKSMRLAHRAYGPGHYTHTGGEGVAVGSRCGPASARHRPSTHTLHAVHLSCTLQRLRRSHGTVHQRTYAFMHIRHSPCAWAGVTCGRPPVYRFAFVRGIGRVLKTLCHVHPPYLPIGLRLPHEKFNPERKPSSRSRERKGCYVISRCASRIAPTDPAGRIDSV